MLLSEKHDFTQRPMRQDLYFSPFSLGPGHGHLLTLYIYIQSLLVHACKTKHQSFFVNFLQIRKILIRLSSLKMGRQDHRKGAENLPSVHTEMSVNGVL